jgi:hypothetical protein
MELDTAQPATAAETEVAPAELSPLDAIKQALSPPQDRPRDEQGRFAPTGEQIEAAEEGEEPEAGAESHEEGEETDEAAEQAQPEAVELPTSWPADKAEIWSVLEPDAQAYIRQRETEQATAINAKFMEAANLRKAHEAEINEAQSNRSRYAEAVDQVLALVQPQKPDPYAYGLGTANYNRDGFDMAQAEYDRASQIINALQHQRQELTAQDERKAKDAEKTAYEAIEATARPAFVMTKVTSALATYDVTTNREDLSDAVYRISPVDTPFMSAVPRAKATAVLHEWSLDTIEATNTTNARLEGDALTRATSASPTRLNNYCQISSRDATVTGTQRATNPAGIDDMMAYQMSKKSLALRKDMEAICSATRARLSAPPRPPASCARSMRGSAATARVARPARTRPGRRSPRPTKRRRACVPSPKRC